MCIHLGTQFAEQPIGWGRDIVRVLSQVAVVLSADEARSSLTPIGLTNLPSVSDNTIVGNDMDAEALPDLLLHSIREP
jgi:hypothetical protein